MNSDATIDFANILEAQYTRWIERDHWPLLLRFNELFESDNHRQALSLARELERRMNDTVTAGFVDAIKSSIREGYRVSSALTDESVSHLVRKANERTRISALNHYELDDLLKLYQRIYQGSEIGLEAFKPVDTSKNFALDDVDADDQTIAESKPQPDPPAMVTRETLTTSTLTDHDPWSALLVASLVMLMALLVYFTLFF
ncbi:MAG: hypothetical protein ACON3Z_03080 [Bradymonadia bacterium]